MIVLGLNAYHGDSSACLVVDGKLINAIEEERIKRIKHWAGLPIESIEWCLSDAKVDISEIDYIAISKNPQAHLHSKLLRVLKKAPSFDFLKSRLSNVAKVHDIKTEIAKGLNIDPGKIKAKVENIEHHLAHIGSTFLVSPFSEAACITVDGFGDFVSTMRAIGHDKEIKIIDWVEFPYSLGILYTAITQLLGFWNYGDEYKVMGLSAYGKSTYLNKMREIVKLKNNGLFELDTSYFLHDKEGVDMVWENGSPVIGKLFSDKLTDAFGKSRDKEEQINERHADIAASLQTVYEEVFFHILNDTFEKTKLKRLTLAGGCIQNSLANGKIFEKTPFKEVYIPPASYDAGTGIGAAFYIWTNVCKKERSFVMNNAYLGPRFTNDEIKNELTKSNCSFELITSEEDLCKKTAGFIAGGKITGWFQGRTEFGPRALGNRSILVDPRKKEMKDILNARIKRREWFRPFAPSVLEEKAIKWFECDYPVPFMEKVYKIKGSKQNLVPAVCHNDGTGRLQTVSCNSNPRYYKLIKEFEAITGVPIILNTSFNDNEPIVNTPQDAINCFLNTKMDVLVLENFIIIKDAN